MGYRLILHLSLTQTQNMSVLARKLNLFQALGLSISIIAPTAAMALNVSLTAQAAGRAAPLAFAIGTAMMAIVGLSFVAFSRRIAHASSVYAYVGHTFGRRCGFIAGWTLLLTYLSYTAGVCDLVGSFFQAAIGNIGTRMDRSWVVIGVGAILLATYAAYRDMRIAARLMLSLEGLSVLAILVLSCIIIAKVAVETGLPSFDRIAADRQGKIGPRLRQRCGRPVGSRRPRR